MLDRNFKYILSWLILQLFVYFEIKLMNNNDNSSNNHNKNNWMFVKNLCFYYYNTKYESKLILRLSILITGLTIMHKQSRWKYPCLLRLFQINKLLKR